MQDRLAEVAFDGRFRYIGFGGAIRGTKTWGSLGLLVVLCKVYPGSRWAVVRKDLPTLRRNTLPSFAKLRETCEGFVGEVNQSTWTATCANGSEIIFFPESFDTDPDLSRWKGLEVNGFLLEEADELQEASFHKAIERAGAWILPGVPEALQPAPYVFTTFNPTPGWPKRVFYEPWKAGTIAAPYAFIPATIADNPFVTDAYRESLKNLPEQEYRRFVEGDWEVLSGRYYDVLDARVHLIPRDALPKELPEWWEYWGAYDWGYAHWAVMGAFARDSQGTTYLLDSVWVRKQQDPDQARTFKAALPGQCMAPVYAGRDCWASMTARGGSGVTTFEVFAQHGVALIQADDDRVNGGRGLRRMLAFKRDQESGEITDPPALLIVDTPGNRRVYDQLAETMPDENNVEKPAKVDCDAEGRGGDDGADMVRYGVSSRLPAAIAPAMGRPQDIHPGFVPGTATRKDANHKAPTLTQLMQQNRTPTRPFAMPNVRGARKVET